MTSFYILCSFNFDGGWVPNYALGCPKGIQLFYFGAISRFIILFLITSLDTTDFFAMCQVIDYGLSYRFFQTNTLLISQSPVYISKHICPHYLAIPIGFSVKLSLILNPIFRPIGSTGIKSQSYDKLKSHSVVIKKQD